MTERSPWYCELPSATHAEVIKQVRDIRAIGIGLGDNEIDVVAEAVYNALIDTKSLQSQRAPVDDGLVERDEYRLMLLDLLAVIHRDGGHKAQEIGIKLAHKQAMKLSSERIAAIQSQPAPVDREGIARALYEHWIQEDCVNEYCEWENLPGKETWLARADAIMQLLTASAAGINPDPAPAT